MKHAQWTVRAVLAKWGVIKVVTLDEEGKHIFMSEMAIGITGSKLSHHTQVDKSWSVQLGAKLLKLSRCR